MPIEDQIIKESSSIEKTLKYAKEICSKHKFVFDENTDRLYEYLDGYYRVVKNGNKSSHIDKIILSCPGGETLRVNERSNIIRNIQILSHVDLSEVENEYINFNNALFNPLTQERRDHTPDIFSVNRIPFNFDISAECPMWISFLKDVMEGDVDRISVLQEFVGYCFMRSCKFEKALVIPGGGQNGKGTFTHVIHNLIGAKNVSSASLEHLSDDVKRSCIIDKYINIDTEVPKRAEKFEAAFKQIVSGENMLFNEKYIAPYSKAPFCKLIFAANKLPRIDESTMGFYRRLIIIPFNKTIKEEDKDVDLKHKLLSELPGIFNWAMAGLRRLNKQNAFSHLNSSKEAIDELRMDNNIVLQYANENLNFHGNDGFGVTKKDLYTDFCLWAKSYGYKQMSMRTFGSTFFYEFRDKTEKDKNNGKLDNKDKFWPGISRKNSNAFGEVISENLQWSE